ncbi:MAG TPA: discoidin domain-containing protein [Nitrososphaeraceae archaeon]|nr:discoidin domain-containing protein [Nitrososphaeraceae archaeon]
MTAKAQSDEKSEKSEDSKKSVDSKKSEADSSNNMEMNVPVAKMIYQNKSYEMSPFVVLDNENLQRINFPHLPDDFEPEVTISPEDSITFSFITKPREINAFFVDYDADTTEMTPLHRVGKTQFSFGDVYGPNTLELRVIYPDGKYVTYTCLIEVEKPEVKEVALDSSNISTMSTDDNINIMSTDDVNNMASTEIPNSNNDNSFQSFELNDPDSSGFGQVSPTEQHVVNQYDNLVDPTNGQQKELDFTNSVQESTNTNRCEYNEIPIMDVQTDTNNGNNNTNGNSTDSQKPRWTALDLGQEQNICGLKVSFANLDNEIKFFTLEFSNDGENYTPAEYYSSTGTNSPSEIYDLKEGPVKARFIKITELDITESIQWISDLTVLGNMDL